jgi:hypothetical protein
MSQTVGAAGRDLVGRGPTPSLWSIAWVQVRDPCVVDPQCGSHAADARDVVDERTGPTMSNRDWTAAGVTVGAATDLRQLTMHLCGAFLRTCTVRHFAE